MTGSLLGLWAATAFPSRQLMCFPLPWIPSRPQTTSLHSFFVHIMQSCVLRRRIDAHPISLGMTGSCDAFMFSSSHLLSPPLTSTKRCPSSVASQGQAVYGLWQERTSLRHPWTRSTPANPSESKYLFQFQSNQFARECTFCYLNDPAPAVLLNRRMKDSETWRLV